MNDNEFTRGSGSSCYEHQWINDDGSLTHTAELHRVRQLAGSMTLSQLQAQGTVEDKDHWLIKGIVSATNTFVYGQSKIGKSFLVAQMIASLVDGIDFLDRQPLSSGHRVLILCTDGGGRLEYQQRLDYLGVDSESVDIIECPEGIDSEKWQAVYDLAEVVGTTVVIADHATALVDGDMNHAEGWRTLWRSLSKFGDGIARVLVGHATDSRFEGSVIHRPSGSSAATALARSRVYLSAPNGIENDPRLIQTLGNNAASEQLSCTRGSDGFIVYEEPAKPKTYERDQGKRETQAEIVRLALDAAPKGTQAEVARFISDQPTVRTTAGEVMSPGTVKINLNAAKGIKWDRNNQRYVRL